MRVASDAGKCQGYGNCVAIDEKHFDLDDDGTVVLLKESVTADELVTTEEAVRSCPVAAIWLEAGQ
jgi:ferredoxin